MKNIGYREQVLLDLKKQKEDKLNELAVPMLKEEIRLEFLAWLKKYEKGEILELSADAEADWIQAQAKAKELLKKQLK